MSHHLTSRVPGAGDAGPGGARASAPAFHEREVRLVRESLWRRPPTDAGTRRGR